MLTVTLASLLVAAGADRSSVELSYPHVLQRDDFCGEADVAMAFNGKITQEQVFALTGVDPALGRGAYTDDLARALRALGVDPGAVWYHPKTSAGVDDEFQAMHDDLVGGRPSIVTMHYSDKPNTTEHMRLVIGYDAASDEVIYQEPAEKDGAHTRMKRALFEKLWTFRPRADRISIIRFRLPAAKDMPVPVVDVETSPSKADAAQHVMKMRDDKMLPAGVTLVWEKPFLVVGDEAPSEVKARAREYVRWTRDLLLKDFFDEAPAHIQEVWILKDAASYVKMSKSLFQRDPDTPYGYYLSERRALIMNIKPGYGTLTHELTHPFFAHAWGTDDDGEAPSWLNEGVASLFERPAEKNGHLVGKVNWRLPSLLSALKDKSAPSFDELVHMTSKQFYEEDRGANYAEARYLCYWLQERGFLAKLVKRAHELRAKDPSGWTALGEVLGKDPGELRPEWERFVRGLAGNT
jgi:hypothetical protein